MQEKQAEISNRIRASAYLKVGKIFLMLRHAAQSACHEDRAITKDL